ncbi:hypothetical protein [Streptomyces aidingensis]|uniref:Uncharacterized protein n=1 Tax=Streptomyces aidingensis TaxID=910347 RepID=A0A1I1S6D1_9ACTN|nr:hypothetical protein [Streptomyces aidingensis]SFD40118.1 hypothetical protein SAMN05421773_114126 [Streptomyces aidingensis]
MSDAVQPTAADVRAAVEALKDALDRHLAAVEGRASGAGGSGADATVFSAFNELAAAGEVYDELLYDVYDEVTPFEVPATDAASRYEGPEEPEALSVLIRRDYLIADPRRLTAQAERITELDPESVDEEEAEEVGARHSVHAAIGVLFGEYEPDEIASRHKEFGLEEGDATTWVAALEERPEPGEWLSAPFDTLDPDQVVCRFDVSEAFDEEDFDAEDR